MTKVLLIGDVHGNVDAYWKILQQNKCDFSLQAGDFGFQKHHDWHLSNIDNAKHLIIFGNHDYWPYINEKHSCGYFTHIPNQNIMTIAGAYSIDQHHRILGRDYFKEEEMSFRMQNELIDYYTLVKPSIIVSHECPQSVRYNCFGIEQSSNTSRLLDALFHIHKPKLWIFGHHHKSLNTVLYDVNFICLNSLETMILDI